jgi:multisubunit Na+/H+ antiporter MnhE subunit
MVASLLPGTLLTGFDPGDDQTVYVHALDVRQPVAAELADEEASFMRMIDHA